MATLGKWSGNTTSLNPGTTWAAPNALFPTQDRNDSSAYTFTSSTSTLTLPSSSLADGYLIIAAVEHEDTSNGRHNPQGRITQASGTGTFVGASTGGYARDTSEDRAYFRCWGFVDNPSASATFQFEWKRDTDAPTGGTVRSEFQVIPFYYSDIGLYSSTSTTATGGTTPTQITGFSGTDGTNVTLTSNVVSVTGDNKRYLVLGSSYHDTLGGGSRTQRWAGLEIDGAFEDAAKGYSYYRNTSNDESGEMFTWLLETVTATVTIEMNQYRGDGVAASQGGADVDGSTTSTAGVHALVVIELNDSAECFRSTSNANSSNLATTGPVDLSISTTTNIDFNDSASFTRETDTGVNCEVAMDALVGWNISAAQNTVSTTVRWTAYAETTVNGVEDSDSFAGDYMRNNQSSQDTFGWSANGLNFQAVTADQNLGVSVTELAGTEGGGGSIDANSGWVGFWAINLDTLEETAVAESLTFDAAAAASFEPQAVNVTGKTRLLLPGIPSIKQVTTAYSDSISEDALAQATFAETVSALGSISENVNATASFSEVVAILETISANVNATEAQTAAAHLLESITANTLAQDAESATAHLLAAISEDAALAEAFSAIVQYKGIVTANLIASENYTNVATFFANMSADAAAQFTPTALATFFETFTANVVAQETHAAIAHYVESITEGINAADTDGAISHLLEAITADSTGSAVFDNIVSFAATLQAGLDAGETWAEEVSAVATVIADAVAQASFSPGSDIAESISENAALAETFAEVVSALGVITEDTQAGETFTNVASFQAAVSANTAASESFVAAVNALADITESANAQSTFLAVSGLLASISAAGNFQSVFTATQVYRAIISESVAAQDTFDALARLEESINFNVLAEAVFTSSLVLTTVFSANAIMGAQFKVFGGGILFGVFSVIAALNALTTVQPSLQATFGVEATINSEVETETLKGDFSVQPAIKGDSKLN